MPKKIQTRSSCLSRIAYGLFLIAIFGLLHSSAAAQHGATGRPANDYRIAYTNMLATPPNSGLSAYGASMVLQYYVSPTGNDANDGSQTRPWATITHADSALILGPQGTTVHVLPGSYYFSRHIVTRHSGTASARIRYISDVQFGAKIRSSAPDNIWWNDADFVDIMGFEMMGAGNPTMNEGISSHGRAHNRFIGNKIHEIPAPCSNQNGGDGIGNASLSKVPPPQDEADIGNIIYNIGISNSPGQCQRVQGIYNSTVGGIVFNNIISNVTSFGIETYHSATHQIISNNTIFNVGGGYGGGGIQVTARAGEGGVARNDYTTVDNNLVVNTGGYGISEYPSVGTHNVYNNNLVIGSASRNFHLIYGTARNNIESGSPGSIFIDYLPNGSGNYHLKTGTIAINRGSTACASTVSNCVPQLDFSGSMRPINLVLDIGAYEFGSLPGAWPWY